MSLIADSTVLIDLWRLRREPHRLADIRARLGHTNLLIPLNPARWAGVRNPGPLPRTAMGIGQRCRCEFARRVTAVEVLKTAQRAELDALFATLQHRAFRGEI